MAARGQEIRAVGSLEEVGDWKFLVTEKTDSYTYWYGEYVFDFNLTYWECGQRVHLSGR